MTKLVIWGMGVVWALVGCGAESAHEEPQLGDDIIVDEPTEDDSPKTDELDVPDPVDVGALAVGQLEQAITARTTPGFQLGTRSGSTGRRCDKTTSGQSCRVLTHKNPVFCFNRSTGLPSGFGGTRPNEIQIMINGFDDVSGWTWTQSAHDPITDNCINQPHSIQVLNTTNSCGASGTASNNIEDYGCAVFSGLTNLTEGMGVVGSYSSASGCSVRVDTADIEAKFATAAQETRAFKHAVGHGLAQCLGIGGLALTPVQPLVVSRITMNVAADLAVLNTGERCLLENYSVANGTQYNQSGTCASE